jgi:hypothetical protein
MRDAEGRDESVRSPPMSSRCYEPKPRARLCWWIIVRWTAIGQIDLSRALLRLERLATPSHRRQLRPLDTLGDHPNLKRCKCVYSGVRE